MTSMLATAIALLAAILFFVSLTGFWIACTLASALLAFSYVTLKRAPRIPLHGLSPEAHDLFTRYHHAWVFSGLTRVTRFALFAWSLVLIGTGAYFLFAAEWLSFGACLGLFTAYTLILGKIDPTAYIRMNGLRQAHDEVMFAFLESREAAAGRNGQWVRDMRDQNLWH